MDFGDNRSRVRTVKGERNEYLVGFRDKHHVPKTAEDNMIHAYTKDSGSSKLQLVVWPGQHISLKDLYKSSAEIEWTENVIPDGRLPSGEKVDGGLMDTVAMTEPHGKSSIGHDTVVWLKSEVGPDSSLVPKAKDPESCGEGKRDHNQEDHDANSAVDDDNGSHSDTPAKSHRRKTNKKIDRSFLPRSQSKPPTVVKEENGRKEAGREAEDIMKSADHECEKHYVRISDSP